MSKSKNIDMTTAPFLKKLILFAVPLMLTGALQLVYNAADVWVIGKFSGSISQAAVGSTGSLVALIVNLFIGLGTGSGVVTAHHLGAHDNERTSRCVQTSMVMSVVSGVAVCAFGFFFSGELLRLMGTPDEVLPRSTLYLKIYFLGAPAALVFNFGSAIVRATGDTKRPLYILAGSGLVNVILNIVLVTAFGLDVAGVAIATITAQYISAVLIVLRLMHIENACRFSLKNVKIDIAELKFIVKIGVPAGLQGSLFSFSNVIIQSAINSFGASVIAGNAIAVNIDGLIYTCTNAAAQTVMTFTSQNNGARKYENFKKIYYQCLCIAFVISLTMDSFEAIFAKPLIGLFNSDIPVIEAGATRLQIMAATYFFSSMMDVAGGAVRGMGKSVQPMIITLIGACGLRIVWIYTIFKLYPTLSNIYISYPITWSITFLTLHISYLILKKRIIQRAMA